jgi:hypothetical protein
MARRLTPKGNVYVAGIVTEGVTFCSETLRSLTDTKRGVVSLMTAFASRNYLPRYRATRSRQA